MRPLIALALASAGALLSLITNHSLLGRTTPFWPFAFILMLAGYARVVMLAHWWSLLLYPAFMLAAAMFRIAAESKPPSRRLTAQLCAAFTAASGICVISSWAL